MPFVVALTGGIGCGKTTVAEQFGRLGAGIVDTDAIARALTKPGEPTLAAIVAAFGPQILTPSGTLDRTRLRERVFAVPDERLRLESLLHPAIRSKVEQELKKEARAPYVVLVVPLLIETGAYRDIADRILVVDCPEELQIERVMRRSGLERSAVEAILRAQASRTQRLVKADDVLVNDGPVEALIPAISALHEKYLELARRDKR
ncbi:MAG TPA: dephospho-CoA kinase [Burkholderiales bacterium]|jgi:dephospho-CoA kinase|nr:dephospho-CoA kinase [Burkholderiales bacterium]